MRSAQLLVGPGLTVRSNEGFPFTLVMDCGSFFVLPILCQVLVTNCFLRGALGEGSLWRRLGGDVLGLIGVVAESWVLSQACYFPFCLMIDRLTCPNVGIDMFARTNDGRSVVVSAQSYRLWAYPFVYDN